jgi:large subunit ribosomal protein L4
MNAKVKTTKKTAAQQNADEMMTGARVITPQDLGLKATDKRSVDRKGFSLCVRALLQNWRQGTVGVKGRSDVSYSNKKPWRQKGTGRARAGSARSPLWRGGGVCHGPQPRTRTLKIAKELKRGVHNSLIWNFLEAGRVICIESELPMQRPQTSAAFKVLKNAGLHQKKINILVRHEDTLNQAMFGNIPNVRVMFFDQANAFDLSNAQSVVVLKKDMSAFKEMVNKWL